MGHRYARTILFICPGLEWTTRERTALRDITIARANGYDVIVFVDEDSYLYKHLKESDIEYICIEPHFLNRLTVFHNHLPIKKLVDERRVDIVHCYDFSYLFSISFQLQRRVMVSLVLTLEHTVEKQLRRYWYRPIITRIDSLILLNKHLRNDAIGGLLLPLKKIEYFGMPLKKELLIPEKETEEETQFELYKDYFLVGCFVSPTLNNIKTLLPLFSSLHVLNQKLPAGKKSKLVFISTANFKDIPIFDSMAKMIQENELQNDMLFVTAKDIETVQANMKLWISIEQNDLIEDYALTAILNDVPVIFTRNFCSTELIREFQGIGETYKLWDARELREKWEKIILSHALYQEKTRVFKYFFEREYSFKNYKTQLLGLYTRIVQRRNRLFKK